ncbi:MAG: hypothetical protein MUF18_17720 [Fimbriiglobus sp.]|jgi:hypothetical protein|nr:hypothetical protein [Fimbriiglobus sp.]
MNLLMLAALALGADDPGPKAGAGVPKLPAFAVTEKAAEKETDLADDRKDDPTVYVFVNADPFKDGNIPYSRPAHRFVKTLDEKIADITGAKVVAVWVGGEADKNKEYVPKVSKYYANTLLGVSAADGNGPKDWGLNNTNTLTAVVAHKGKVVKAWAFDSVNETDVPKVVDELKKAAEKK